MSFAEILDLAEQLHGWMSRKELDWLASTAATLPQGATWLEIGAWCGRSTMAVGLSLPENATLNVVDRFCYSLPVYTEEFVHEVKPYETFQRTMAFLRAARPDVSFRVWEIDSKDIDKMITHLSCDVAFVDADHSFEAVIGDCGRCEMVLKPEGVLCGHDYHQETNPDVIRAVDFMYPNRQIVPETSIWFVTRN